MALDYSRFKQDINLTQYAAHLGYEVDRKKSTRSSIAMRSGGDKVIISRRNAMWVYFSVTDDQDNGTILDFAEKRTGKTIAEIGKELNTWLNGSATLPEPKSYIAEVAEQEYDPERVKRIFGNCRVVTKHAYLEGRGVTRAVLSAQRFEGRIFIDRYQNAVFPHYGAKGICGLELKNTDKCFFARGSEKTLWRSNARAGDSALIIAEAVLDALSYHQLFEPQNAMYAASGGGMSPEQAALIRLFSQTTPALKKIIIITDNDDGGDRLTGRIIAAIEDGAFSGQVIRHSPPQRGADWNDVLSGSYWLDFEDGGYELVSGGKTLAFIDSAAASGTCDLNILPDSRYENFPYTYSEVMRIAEERLGIPHNISIIPANHQPTIERNQDHDL